ncbi:hypothetical protein U1Q18_025295, partial [Sarracenia purpurea var. burkii]
YASRFEELSRYATALVLDEESKARRIEWGLHPVIRGKLMFMQFPTYGQVMQAALVAKEELMDSRKVWNQKKGNAGGGGLTRNQKGWVNQKSYSRNSGQDSKRGFRSSTIVCFECNSPGHKRSECPRLTKGIGQKGNFHANNQGKILRDQLTDSKVRSELLERQHNPSNKKQQEEFLL